MTERSPVEARNWPPRAVAAMVMLGLGALGYLLFHVLPFYSYHFDPFGDGEREMHCGWTLWCCAAPCSRACRGGVLW